ncbi:hypothetical protein G6O69_10845 [Pseudenhygromyxa sp. WMMC2535]|uniref:hypothetical protein n=1 Tax=Pseudenhygromyxa sp. WMMC2535 TaxID=2712867 RepID=UPI001552016A|nr:hypothetical protein [Pseudenhygromyxa sp. WMMC2535]NVB38329.1 hypothetical protein [Pseudenhygromyxa sp. WMMC2535]
MDVINRYHVELRGQPGFSSRAQILLLGADDRERAALGRIHFYDAGVQLPTDAQSDGVIEMHLPMDALAGVIALLQHDKPIKIGFVDGNAILRTGEWEPVGESERD